jgi:hypothetical protein
LLAVPPGQQPTRITPAATSGDIGIMRVSKTARSGIIRNWAITPISTSNGRLATSAKSLVEIVRPMPNMMMPSNTTIHGANTLNVDGSRKPSTAKTIIQTAKERPTKSDNATRAFISLPSDCAQSNFYF